MIKLPKNLEPRGLYTFFQDLWLCVVAVFCVLMCYGILAGKITFAGYAIGGMLVGTVMYLGNDTLRKQIVDKDDDNDTPSSDGSSSSGGSPTSSS